MNDPIQIILLSSIVVLTTLFVIIGIWLILILKEAHKTAQTLNQTATNIEGFTAKLNEPVEFLSGMIRGLEEGLEVVNLIKQFFRHPKKNE